MSDQQHNNDFYRFKIDRFDCISVSDGTYDYNPLQLFPGLTNDQVKEVLSIRQLRTDKIVSPYTFLFVDTGKHKVLCDMGAGRLGPDTGKLLKNLKLAGVQPEEIDTIL
jgi:hypothetical protein